MPSHLSSLGFIVDSEDDLLALANELGPKAVSIPVKGGQYFQWQGLAGEELWLNLNDQDRLVGVNPHFSGAASMPIAAQARFNRDPSLPLEGAFQVWANPQQGNTDDGDYPFVFDCPDWARSADILLPGHATVQLSAFAHEIEYFDSEQDYEKAQTADKVGFASRSFIPSGLFTTDEHSQDSPEATAFFTGLVLKAETKTNSHTGRPFYWALVDTLGGTFDVVVDPELLEHAPREGSVISGSFWISGRLLEYVKKRKRWLKRRSG